MLGLRGSQLRGAPITSPRRFLPPWQVEQILAATRCWTLAARPRLRLRERDAPTKSTSTMDEARRIAANIAKAPSTPGSAAVSAQWQGRAAVGESRRPSSLSAYEQVLVEESHFMWAFSQACLVFGASAANDGTAKPTARPNAIITETSFLMEASPKDGTTSLG
jgi:hypothetical protein